MLSVEHKRLVLDTPWRRDRVGLAEQARAVVPRLFLGVATAFQHPLPLDDDASPFQKQRGGRERVRAGAGDVCQVAP
jgi:hypothetical protein